MHVKHLGRDNRLRELGASEIQKWAEAVLKDLNDLCVLLLFSVVETIVRDRALKEVEEELPAPRHPAWGRCAWRSSSPTSG